MVNHVLSRFHKSEMPTVHESVGRAADSVEVMLSEGLEPAMNRFNSITIPT